MERRPDRVRQIKANQARFGAADLMVVQGEAPEVLAGLPDPDRIFIGGGGPALADIIRISAGRLAPGGVVVAAAVLLHSLETAGKIMTEEGLVPDIVQIQISRGADLGGDKYLKALNPVWLVTGWKKTDASHRPPPQSPKELRSRLDGNGFIPRYFCGRRAGRPGPDHRGRPPRPGKRPT